ncbi:tRNA (guanine-N(7)-)-methyltransferase [Thecamonas trahens ATCC 50062]|uniref:tRNA (guanine(46)-N(7))-methyltransferase n=1 Tax=Thecamonas trahens ATCC 50062 TaxID=461836 RepID=A0A0L0DB53_THETB|nr:tRNA (guanine-N(7)-)-methyltransferase [Thecamonas trahens ATCC 50062]KNC49336.1 tRNA (guanine-N(7)-)-methyltransferase [Thecamonas trahens ATCC 50062]|eukprot:XP_013758044.1 tRNA (guanine-N(7)-)-methyltransferase [Thecamonas trahens ATCC 50062]
MKYPVKPDLYPWHEVYPAFVKPEMSYAEMPKVEIADIGCGFGGLLMALSPLFPDTLIMGMEIRLKVSAYVHERIVAARANGNGCQNLAVTRTNSMKHLAKNHRRRIISQALLAEYAYTLRVGGMLYTVTDVLDLHQWMVEHLDAHPLFERIPDADVADDPCLVAAMTKTEEGIKVARNSGDKYPAVYRRIDA